MNSIKELLAQLNARLPELEWKISGLNVAISSSNVPKGLFRSTAEITGSGCVDEIKADIQQLSLEDNERSAFFLAERIKQKVNVLVALCQMEGRKTKSEERASFGVTMLSTRRQWISDLEANINTLTLQQQAIANTLEQMTLNNNAEAILSLRAELGAVDKRLTLAKEALQQALS